jgi:hypothetical protein
MSHTAVFDETGGRQKRKRKYGYINVALKNVLIMKLPNNAAIDKIALGVGSIFLFPIIFLL